MNAASTSTSDKDFVISRVYDAPRDLVWRACTEPERMQHWWGPKGFTVVVSKMDLRIGGTYHYGLKAPDGNMMWGKFAFRQVTPPQRLEFISSFSDEAGGTTRHPMAPDWPLEMLTAFTFDEEGAGKTRFTVRSSAHNASEAERKVFDTSHGSLQQGWGGTLDQLAAYLAKA